MTSPIINTFTIRRVRMSKDTVFLISSTGHVALIKPTYWGLRHQVSIYRCTNDASHRIRAIEDNTLWTPWAAKAWALARLTRTTKRDRMESSQKCDGT